MATFKKAVSGRVAVVAHKTKDWEPHHETSFGLSSGTTSMDVLKTDEPKQKNVSAPGAGFLV